MSKAVLVMDLPECCGDCKLGDLDPSGLYCIPADNYFDGNDSSEEKAAWCPLRELPERKKLSGNVSNIESLGKEIAAASWNECLDAIEGSAEHE
ncbi:hypothetical protein [Qiania dongpingensis]|uniref:Uncharacterized protein n=1 Tax=Qiania dongpingensis TaxID=2763669 RepID=A0A7G9G702_9FIRM|nr:hypothetical protein [Qiania dongpingensis]QNM06584.1 hypothetical protein H9Q78_05480 [Qiania dongpingensis]